MGLAAALGRLHVRLIPRKQLGAGSEPVTAVGQAWGLLEAVPAPVAPRKCVAALQAVPTAGSVCPGVGQELWGWARRLCVTPRARGLSGLVKPFPAAGTVV